MTTQLNRRILIVDDTPAIHEDFRKILAPPAPAADLDDVEAALFGTAVSTAIVGFELDSAYQGQEGLAKVCAAQESGRPYALALVDMRMPPGWDGIETIERIWQVDPLIQIVICTAYSEYAWDEVLARLEVGDRLLILKKPFDAIEVYQLASALTAKWQMTRQAAMKMAALEAAVATRTGELRAANAALQAEIAERKHLESQLIQSEKLASIGQLAAGVAHEINNPIGFVLANHGTLGDYHNALCTMLAEYRRTAAALAPPEAVASLESRRSALELDVIAEDLPALMRETREGILRVQKIVCDLREFARVDATEGWQLTDLHQGIEAALSVASGKIGGQVAISRDYGTLPEVECLPSQINQVIMNLLVNAAQAIAPGAGRITLRTGASGDQAWIEVADTGRGISAENLPRIFDPFFTTQPVGQGAGLGLSMSYGIVQRHRGQLEVRSELGRGTTVRVQLPIRQVHPPGPPALHR